MRLEEQSRLSSHFLMIGPPNVGKSALFNQLTGLEAQVANYVGTTVEFSRGAVTVEGQEVELIDVPGTYTLNASNEAEAVAVEMLKEKPAGVLCILDGRNLESSLYLLLQVLEMGLPTVAVLNRYDLLPAYSERQGVDKLAQALHIPVVPTIAIEGRGLEQLKEVMASLIKEQKAATPVGESDEQSRWQKAEELKNLLYTGTPQSWKREDKLIRPIPGLPVAFLVLALVLGLVIGVGMGLRRFILLPGLTFLVIEPLVFLVDSLLPPGLVQDILIGDYGFLIKGIEWPFTLVLPYVLSFYGALSFLEDSGYLPRLAVLLDGLLGKIGLSGSSVIPILLGYGCGIPGIMATRALGGRKERIMVSTLICLAVPCISQTGAFISLLGERSLVAVLGVFAVSIVVMILGGLVMDRLLPGRRPFTIMEIPDLMLPSTRIMGKKLLLRLKSYVRNGAIPMFWAVGFSAILYETGLMVWVGQLLEPLVEGWLRLPRDAAIPLILGIMRRELAVLPLLDMDLTTLQLFVGAVVALFYVPCIAMIATLAREFRLTLALCILALTTTLAFVAGGILARLGSLIL